MRRSDPTRGPIAPESNQQTRAKGPAPSRVGRFVLRCHTSCITMHDMADPRRPSDYFARSAYGSQGQSHPSHLVSIRLSDDLVRRLAEVGNREGTAMSDTIRLVLERGLSISGKTSTKHPSRRPRP